MEIQKKDEGYEKFKVSISLFILSPHLLIFYYNIGKILFIYKNFKKDKAFLGEFHKRYVYDNSFPVTASGHQIFKREQVMFLALENKIKIIL